MSKHPFIFAANSLAIMQYKPQVKNSLDLTIKNFPAIGSTLNMDTGAQEEIYASEPGAETNTFFMVYNPNETGEGSWEVEIGNEE